MGIYYDLQRQQNDSKIGEELQQKRCFLPCVFPVLPYNNGNQKNVRSCG